LTESDKKKIEEQDLNTYEGIAEHYDTLMTDGYYDYDEISKNLCAIIGERRKLMELGVGTGLVADNLLKANPDFKITGVDNTPAMISQAKEKLGDRIAYELQDITKLSIDTRFEAAFSVGGCWYFIDNGPDKELEFCSHIDDLETSKQGLKNVAEHLEKGGVLALALQAPHTNYSKELSNELTYSQEIFKEDNGFTKHYSFTSTQGVIAEQFYRYLVLPESEVHDFFKELDCKPLGLCPSRNFFVYQKN
tara:strand:+ start:69927 stop:70673 length:747 start_codon:yes stop_codon:yes gene_type:complete